MITREQVADLQPGDVVEMAIPDGTVIRGPLTSTFEDWLYLGPYLLRAKTTWPSAKGGNWPDDATLTVVSRAPRPLHDCPDCTHLGEPDPLAWVVKGTDPAPPGVSEYNSDYCGHTEPVERFVCTREKGHVGQHIAGTGRRQRVAAVWS